MQEHNRWEEEAREAKEASRRLKRRILIVAVAVVLVLGLLYGLILLLEAFLTPETEELPPPPSVTYFPPDYDYDIMQDPDYLELDRRIYYTNGNERFPLTDENIEEFGPAVSVLRDMINCIIDGDHEGYNALFSPNYFAVDGRAPEEEFTMQRVYGVELVREAESSHVDPATGKTYKQYVLTVSYKIHKNDGTFRLDLGHDDARKQYFVLSDQSGDQVRIDQIMNYKYVNKAPENASAEIITISVVSAVVVLGMVGTVLIIRSRRKKNAVSTPSENTTQA